MKCLVVDVTSSEKEGINTCWFAVTKLAKWDDEKQKVFHFKKSEMLNLFPIVKTKNLELYDKAMKILPGTIVDVEQVVNDRGYPVLKDIILFKECPYNFDEIYK